MAEAARFQPKRSVTYVTVAPAFLHLYSKHPVHMHVWRTWNTTHERPRGCASSHLAHRVAKERIQWQSSPASMKAQAHTVLDVRPERLEQGGEPFVSMMEAASTITPGGTLVIIAPFEPVPLYDVLGTHRNSPMRQRRWQQTSGSCSSPAAKLPWTGKKPSSRELMQRLTHCNLEGEEGGMVLWTR